MPKRQICALRRSLCGPGRAGRDLYPCGLDLRGSLVWIASVRVEEDMIALDGEKDGQKDGRSRGVCP